MLKILRQDLQVFLVPNTVGSAPNPLNLLNFVCLLFYILAISKVTSAWVLTCASAHLWQPYSAVSLGNSAASTMATQYPTQSPYPLSNQYLP